MNHALRVAVLMGGPSAEHEISLKSGRGVMAALGRRRWKAEPVLIPRALSIPDAVEWTRRTLERIAPDVAFLALHGTFGEDGTIQAVCEQLHLAYTGSNPAASRLGMDKIASRIRCAEAGLAAPRWQVVTLPANLSRLRVPAYPVVVKPSGQGSSLGVSIVRTPAELPAALAEAGRYDARLLIEEFIRGREVTAGVFGDDPLPLVEIRPRHPFFDFAAKYTTGLTEYLVPAPLDPAVSAAAQRAGLAAHRALGCRHLSRADFMLTPDNTPVLLEVNTIPGFTPTSLLPKAAACDGLSYDDLCEQLVLMAASDLTHVTSNQ